MKSLKLLAALFLLGMVQQTQAQDWQLVWSDEFTNSISSDWVFETGNGSDGWGNRELEYYRRENATVQDGKLVIAAKRESFGGYNYTSVRMKTAGKKSWKYGKIEALISIPSFQGSWPAFWMLGESGNWPASGEIDIMEHVNTGSDFHGTIHWADAGGGHASYGQSTNSSTSGFHKYTIIWTEASIKWFIDDVQYNEANIANNINSTEEFHKNFYILLNFAIGGNWPGFTVDNNAFPANMVVDYVRVYQQGSTPPPPSGVIEAENFSLMQGVQTEACTDTGGGLNVGYIDTGDWMKYSSITIPTTGQYKIDYRVASQNGGGHLSLDLNSGTTVLGGVDVPSTGGWQTWTTVSHTVNINAGTYDVGIFATTGGWNLNWFKITPVMQSTTIQAESFTSMLGVQTEACTDTDGGQDVGYIDAGDWMAYSNITIPTTGAYKVEYRVASQSGGGSLSLDLNAGSTVLGGVSIPATGGWQTWTTVSHTVNINAGTYALGIFAPAGGWNLNWIRITPVASSIVASAAVSEITSSSYPTEVADPAIRVYPNPVASTLTLESNEDLSGTAISVHDKLGNQVLSTVSAGNSVDVSTLPPGTYIVRITHGGKQIVKRFVKK